MEKLSVFPLMSKAIPKRNWSKTRQDGDFLIVMANNLRISYLNKTAAFLLQQVDDRRSVGEIADAMLEQFSVGREKLENDVVAVLRELEGKGVLSLRYEGSDRQ